jgi:hypothetical protein
MRRIEFLFALVAFSCTTVKASNVSVRTFPYTYGSLSSDGYYMCFTSAANVNSYTAYCTSSSASYDYYGYCAGSIGSYYCNKQYSATSSSVASMSVAYSGITGRCYESPGAAYSSTPCTYSQLRIDYAQSGACYGTWGGLYVYYCPSNYASLSTISPLTYSGQSGATCYLTASTCRGYCNSGSCVYDSNNQCQYASGYYAYCSASTTYSYSTLGVPCFATSTSCLASYNVSCNSDSTVCSGASSGYTYYSPSSASVYSYTGSSQSSDGYCYVSSAAASYQTVCAGSIIQDSSRTGACSGAYSGFTYYCPSSSSLYSYSSLGIRCFSSATACASYGYIASTCVADANVCSGASGGKTYYSYSSSLTGSSSGSYNGAFSIDSYCYVSQLAADYWTVCTTSQISQDSTRSSVCHYASSGFTYYCPATYSSPPPAYAPPPPTGTYTAATNTNCGTYTTINSPLNTCGATTTLAACQAICDASPGCVGLKYATRMNVVAPCGSNYKWCMLLSAYTASTCIASTDIWDMYYRSIAAGSSPATPTSTPTPTSGNCNTAACSGCTSCTAAQTCANTYYCTGNQYVTNFQCSTVNGVGTWSATCASSPTPTSTPSTQITSSATLVKSAAGIIAATAAAMFI